MAEADRDRRDGGRLPAAQHGDLRDLRAVPARRELHLLDDRRHGPLPRRPQLRRRPALRAPARLHQLPRHRHLHGRHVLERGLEHGDVRRRPGLAPHCRGDDDGAHPQPRPPGPLLLARGVLLSRAALARGGRPHLALDPPARGAPQPRGRRHGRRADQLADRPQLRLRRRSRRLDLGARRLLRPHPARRPPGHPQGSLRGSGDGRYAPGPRLLAHHAAAPCPQPSSRHRSGADPRGAGVRRSLCAHRRRPGHLNHVPHAVHLRDRLRLDPAQSGPRRGRVDHDGRRAGGAHGDAARPCAAQQPSRADERGGALPHPPPRQGRPLALDGRVHLRVAVRRAHHHVRAGAVAGRLVVQEPGAACRIPADAPPLRQPGRHRGGLRRAARTLRRDDGGRHRPPPRAGAPRRHHGADGRPSGAGGEDPRQHQPAHARARGRASRPRTTPSRSSGSISCATSGTPSSSP